MFLDTTTKSLEIVLGATVTTNQLPITVDYVDMSTTDTIGGASDTVSNSATAVTILSSPTSSAVRKVNGITVYNADTVATVVTVRLNNNSTLRNLISCTLSVGDTLGYTDSNGWYVQDSIGNRKTAAATVTSIIPVCNAYKVTNQSIVSATWTKVQINTLLYDSEGYFDTVNNRYTPLVAGYYDTSALVTINSTSVTLGIAAVYKNGTASLTGPYHPGVSNFTSAAVGGLIYLNGSTDYIELWGYANGTSPSVYAGAALTYFEIYLIKAV